MFIQVRSGAVPMTPELERHARDRFSSALSNFASRLQTVTVRIADLNGPRGGVDKQCRVAVSLAEGGVVVAEGRGESVGQAVARAASRAREQLRRRARKRERPWQRAA